MSLCLPALVCWLTSSAWAIDVPVSSTFDSGLEGWTIEAGQTTQLSHAPSGGNPGGFLQAVDQGPIGGDVFAPAGYLGNWSNLNGRGILSWDFQLFQLGPTTGDVFPLRAAISGPGGAATFNSGTVPPLGSWVSINAPLVEAAWIVTSGDWTGLLADVDVLRIWIEPVFTTMAPGERTGIDNVVLALPANGVTQVEVTYTNLAPPTGPVSFGLTNLPISVPALFILKHGAVAPNSFTINDVLFAELRFGDGTWTLDELVSFSMTVDALGEVTDLTYQFGSITTPTAVANPILNSSFMLTVGGTDIVSGLDFEYVHQDSTQELTVFAPPALLITHTALVPGGIALSGTGGTSNGMFRLLSSSELSVPVTNWPAISTNTFDGNGNFSLTNSVSPGETQQFYRLLKP